MFCWNEFDIHDNTLEIEKDGYWTERKLSDLKLWKILKQLVKLDKQEFRIGEVNVRLDLKVVGFDIYGFERYVYQMYLNNHLVLSFNDFDFNHRYKFIWESWVEEHEKISTYTNFIMNTFEPFLDKVKQEQEDEESRDVLLKIQEIGL